MSRSFAQPFVYSGLRIFARLFGVTCYGLRCEGRENWPASGGGLVCANHQSFFDPPLVGLTCPRQMNFLARDTLFKVPVLRQVIAFLDAIPIDRDGLGLEGLKETIRRLRGGEMVLIFPEGTRSSDGNMSPLKPGFCAVAKRSGATLLPVGIDGAYQAWPRNAHLPRPSRIVLQFGQPLSPDYLDSLSNEELLIELDRSMNECHQRARAIRLGSSPDNLSGP